MKIENAHFSLDTVSSNDIFVGALGFDERSFYLLNKMYQRVNRENILIFSFDLLVNARKDTPMSSEIASLYNGISFQSATYNDYALAEKVIKGFISQRIADNENAVSIHIDYSSMPRKWYCSFPNALLPVVRKKDSLLFWYVDGEYPDDYINYPSAGIHSFVHFSGKPTLRSNSKRLHVISLSYDIIRTQATISLLDPDSIVMCAAYDSRNDTILDNVISINKEIRPYANMFVTLQMDDFEFMVAKLCEIANEYVSDGDVVFVPDGPKPLIFAESLVPTILNNNGISCLHIIRNNRFFNPVEVLPTENIIGVCFRKD